MTSRSINTSWSKFIELLVNTLVKWYRKSGIRKLTFTFVIIDFSFFIICFHSAGMDFYLRRRRQKQVKESLSPSIRPSVPARQYLLSVICNSNSFQSILFKLCTVFVYILWADLKIFFHTFSVC